MHVLLVLKARDARLDGVRVRVWVSYVWSGKDVFVIEY